MATKPVSNKDRKYKIQAGLFACTKVKDTVQTQCLSFLTRQSTCIEAGYKQDQLSGCGRAVSGQTPIQDTYILSQFRNIIIKYLRHLKFQQNFQLTIEMLSVLLWRPSVKKISVTAYHRHACVASRSLFIAALQIGARAHQIFRNKILDVVKKSKNSNILTIQTRRHS